MIWGWSVCGFVAACVWFVGLCLVCGVSFWLLIGLICFFGAAWVVLWFFWAWFALALGLVLR